jgi:UDP-glucose 4-epimerase
MCTRDIDVIVHLAANTGVAPSVENPRTDMEANVIGTLNVLEAARQNNVKRFVFASSGAPAGEAEPPIHEEIAPHPVSPYGASKLAGEGYCSAYYRTYGLKTVVLRFGNVYGSGSFHKSSVVAKFIRQGLKGMTCEIYGDGKQTRDFIYIDDLVDAVLKAVMFEGGGEIFQIATSKEYTIKEMAEILIDELGQKGTTVHLVHRSQRKGDVRRNFSNTAKARKFLRWQAEVDLREGIRRTVGWFMGI